MESEQSTALRIFQPRGPKHGAPKNREEEKKMAFSRAFLKALQLTDEQISSIIEAHTDVVDALKKQRDDYKADVDKWKAEADKLPGIQKELEALKSGDDFKAKYEKEHSDFEAFKAGIETEKVTARKIAAYRELLKAENIADKRHDLIVEALKKAGRFDAMKLDKDGKLEGLDDLKKGIADEWGEFRVTTRERKQTVPTPPKDNPGSAADGRAKTLAQMYHANRYGSAAADPGKE